MGLKPIEKACISAFRNHSTLKKSTSNIDDPVEWLQLGLSLILKTGSIIRKLRLQPLKNQIHFKEDGSPVTRDEEQIELFVRQSIARFHPDVKMLGEESGGQIPSSGLAVAIDPIDGTWALLNRMETCATSLVFLRDLEPFLGMVLNPVTGELGYAFSNRRTRLLQFSMFGEQDMGYDLPLESVRSNSLLINVHPSRKGAKLMDRLFRLWNQSGLDMVKMSGGSPSFALLEAAKGSFNYINLWSDQPAAAYDLLAGILLVRGAGGEVTDISGKPIKNIGHSGPFVAGVDEKVRLKVTKIIQNAINFQG